jgi:TolB-like protein/class 3 adenylate cyclase/Flp pilus assembly protein TadD
VVDGEKPRVRFELAHVLFIDVVGYSKLRTTEQSARIQQLREIVRSTEQFRAAEAEGTLLRLPTGDGGALVFRRLEAPLLCAVEIAKALRSHPELPVRMGIHSGPVNEVTDLNEQANIAGAGINIAQRIMDCGDAGHILVSKHAAEDLEQHEEWQPYLHDIGQVEIKHGERLHVVNFYDPEVGNPAMPGKFKAANWPARASPATRRNYLVAGTAIAALIVVGATILFLTKRNDSRALAQHNDATPAVKATIPEKSVAVLPFENLTSDKENAYFADGIQEEVLTRLAKIADLKVISRTSTLQYKSAPENLSQIAQQLGVAHVVEGSVQKSGEAVRVNVQLINALTDAHLWAETYDRKLTDAFALETDIAKAIADKLQARISGRESDAISKHPTEDSEAHQLYLKGRYFWNKRSADGLRTSINYFSQAIEKDPAYALAYAGLADAHAVLPNYSRTRGPEAYPKAEAAAVKALELDDGIAEAHIALANVRLWHRWGNGAEAEFRKGLQLDPNYSTGHQWYSIYLSVTGRADEAIAEMERARELDPFSIIINTELGCPYLYSKRYARAIEYFRKAVEMDPNFPFAHFALAEAYDRVGRYREAWDEHEKALELAQRGRAVDLSGGDAPRAWYALTGPLQNARREIGGASYWQDRLASTTKLHEDGSTTATAVASVYAILGDNEQAIAWLEKAYQQSDDFMVFVNIQPQFEMLRGESRFRALMDKVLHGPVAATK